MAAASLDATARVLGNYAVRQESMEAAALAGIEQAIARINGDPSLYPELGKTQLTELRTLGSRFAQPPKARVTASDAA